jgi:hypothetical protein
MLRFSSSDMTEGNFFVSATALLLRILQHSFVTTWLPKADWTRST